MYHDSANRPLSVLHMHKASLGSEIQTVGTDDVNFATGWVKNVSVILSGHHRVLGDFKPVSRD